MVEPSVGTIIAELPPHNFVKNSIIARHVDCHSGSSPFVKTATRNGLTLEEKVWNLVAMSIGLSESEDSVKALGQQIRGTAPGAPNPTVRAGPLRGSPSIKFRHGVRRTTGSVTSAQF